MIAPNENTPISKRNELLKQKVDKPLYSGFDENNLIEHLILLKILFQYIFTIFDPKMTIIILVFVPMICL